MNETLEFVVRHGAAVLFVAVFIEQMGVPLPAAPWLLAAGALSGAGKMSWVVSLLAAGLGSLLADLIWFYLGRRYGNSVLGVICRISLEPDSCVRRTQNLFTRFGMRGLVVAKFVPGLSTLAPPLAGSTGVTFPRFLFFDSLSGLLYGSCYILLGIIFSRQLDQVINALGSIGGNALAVVAALVAAYLGYKFYRRHRLLKELQMARITVDELHQLQEAGAQPLILDLRSLDELQSDPALIRGARHSTMDEVELMIQAIPRDRDIVLYCSCPNEVTSAKVALQLRRKGIARVRPLLGGIDAWRERKYPTELKGAGAPDVLAITSLTEAGHAERTSAGGS
jgi:membrane protein DedA with SNARE-associated domain/rhodanese-related sulfurtransferase